MFLRRPAGDGGGRPIFVAETCLRECMCLALDIRFAQVCKVPARATWSVEWQGTAADTDAGCPCLTARDTSGSGLRRTRAGSLRTSSDRVILPSGSSASVITLLVGSSVAEKTPLVFHLDMIGSFANRMIEYMIALKFRSLVPDCVVSNVALPDWNIFHQPIDAAGLTVTARQPHHLPLHALSSSMKDGSCQRVEYSGFGQRLENFLQPDDYRDVFVCPFREALGFGDDVLLCPIRAGDVADGSAPDYPLIPPRFYLDLVAQTGLKPVFMGQTERNAYTERLRRQFPDASFLDSRGPMRDFETIRQSKNIAVGVSTFVWLAAWLSHARSIHLAVNGLFNPMQRPAVDLLPFNDRRYHFHLFPLNYGCGLDEQEAAHRIIEPYWRLMPAASLQHQISNAPRFPRDIDRFLSVFDEQYYVQANPDIGHAIADGSLRDGLTHYRARGFDDRRFPFPLDRKWYAMSHPLAAFEVAQGDYTDFAHQYLAVGRERGYRPLPPD
jgi:hypothetical protein